MIDRVDYVLGLSSLIYKVFGLDIGLTGGLSTSALDLFGSLGENTLLGVVHLAQLVEINVGSLDNLDLSDLDVLDWIDGGDLLGDLLLDDFRGEEIEDLGGVGLGNLLGNDVVDSLSDELLLGGEGVVGLALLVGGLSGEGNNKDSQHISVLRLDILNCFNECFSFLDEGAQLVTSDIHSIEGGDGLSSLGLVDNELDLPPVEGILVGCKISLHGADNSSLDAVLNFF